MKSPVLLAVVGVAGDFEALFAAARERGVRVGWLELESAVLPPPDLAFAPPAGAFRAVAVGNRISIAVKPMKGAPVLRDLVREHFLGADVVLVKGTDLFPKLSAVDGGWKLGESPTNERRLSLDELFARLRKPELRWTGKREQPGG